MTRNILVILGHPDPNSLNAALASAYADAAGEAGASVRMLTLGALSFDPIMRGNYHTETGLAQILPQLNEYAGSALPYSMTATP